MDASPHGKHSSLVHFRVCWEWFGLHRIRIYIWAVFRVCRRVSPFPATVKLAAEQQHHCRVSLLFNSHEKELLVDINCQSGNNCIVNNAPKQLEYKKPLPSVFLANAVVTTSKHKNVCPPSLTRLSSSQSWYTIAQDSF